MTIQGQVFCPATADAPELPIEVAFLRRHGVSEAVLRCAAHEAETIGVGADAALIKNGHLDEDAFYRALAAELGAAFLDERLRLCARTRFPESVLAGAARLASGLERAGFVVAPTGERIVWMLQQERSLDTFAITTPSRLQKAVVENQAREVARQASDTLHDRRPDWAAKDGLTGRQRLGAMAATGLLAFAGMLAPRETLALAMMTCGLIFVAMVILRVSATLQNPRTPIGRFPRRPDRILPFYTVIVPLRREERVLDQLIAALGRLDYPKPKLDIKLVVEADDRDMIDALAARTLPPWLEVVVAPRGEPRTKPRALNVALPLARGELVVVYDAEDVPEPSQLRLAAEMFARASPDVACLQARLVIDNAGDNWLTRLFAIEYAALFDVVNPALAAWNFPIPLGGTSNHFRRSALRALHGWDSWNVTEDADLGMRLALAGYRVLDLPSSTLEEAPVTFRGWLKQRTRWMKGFMQVVITHSRRPVAAFRTLGPARFFSAATTTLGTVMTALAYPAFTGASLLALWNGSFLEAQTVMEIGEVTFGLVLLPAGMAAMIVPALAGLRRRRWLDLMAYVPWLPAYYALISIAAWRALWELALGWAGWHKTEHGFARTSRSGLVTTREAALRLPQPEGGRG